MFVKKLKRCLQFFVRYYFSKSVSIFLKNKEKICGCTSFRLYFRAFLVKSLYFHNTSSLFGFNIPNEIITIVLDMQSCVFVENLEF